VVVTVLVLVMVMLVVLVVLVVLVLGICGLCLPRRAAVGNLGKGGLQGVLMWCL
jgi:hypothetical protein